MSSVGIQIAIILSSVVLLMGILSIIRLILERRKINKSKSFLLAWILVAPFSIIVGLSELSGGIKLSMAIIFGIIAGILFAFVEVDE